MSATVLLVCGHVGIESLTGEGLRPERDVATLRRSTGSRGEREYVGFVAPLLADALRRRGVDVTVHDATYARAVYERRYDLVLNLHYMRDSASSRAFAGIPAEAGVGGAPYLTPTARARSQQWADRFHNEYPIVTGIPATPEKAGENLTHNYVWDWPTADTPCVLAELGHADIDAAVLFAPGAVLVVQALDLLTAEYLEHDLGLQLALAGTVPVPLPSPAADPWPLASFPVAGVWEGEAAALEAAVAVYAQGRAPAGVGRLYAEIGRLANVRADVLVAQAMHETGRFAYGGSDPVFSADPTFHNFAGIKTTDGTATARFRTPTLGVKAHAYHLAWYAHPGHVNPDCSPAFDPRHFGPEHRNNVRTIADLGAKWAPSPEYGRGVARHLAEIRALLAAYVPPATRRDDAAIAADLRALAAELERVA